MKKISYLMSMAVALVMGFASCSNDDNLSSDAVNPGGETAVEEGLPAKVRITLSQSGNTLTRAEANTDPDAEATGPEKKIKNAQVLIFKAPSKNATVDKILLEKVVDINNTKENETVSETAMITTGTKYFYTVINASLYKDTDEGVKTLGEAKKEMKEYGELFENDKSSFLLTTVEQPKFTTVTGGEGDEAQEIELKVGRASAKVQLTTKDDKESRKIKNLGTLEDFHFKLVSERKQTYVLPQFDDKGLLRTPGYDTKEGPAFVNEGASAFTAFYGAENAVNQVYTSESSTVEDYLKYGRVSNVMIRGTFVPNPEILYNLKGEKVPEFNPGEDEDYAYYVFRSEGATLPIVFVAQGEDIQPKEGDDKTKTVDYLNIKAYNEALKVYYSAINATSDMKLIPEDAGIKTPTTVGKISLETDEDGNIIEVKVDENSSKYEVRMYYKGKTYYTTVIKDTKNYTTTLDQVAVRRNHLYKLTVNSISRLGSNSSLWSNDINNPDVTKPQDNEDVVGGGDDNNKVDPEVPTTKPEGPSEKPEEDLDNNKPVDINVSVEVDKWVVVDHGVDL